MSLDYSQWKTAHESFLQGFGEKQVLLLFSGGKDSSAAMDLMSRAAREFGFSFEAHGAAFPVHRYGREQTKRISDYWMGRGVDLTWHRTGENDEKMSRAENPCVYCQGVRKKMLKSRMPDLVPDWKRLVLVVSFSLSDLVSYSLEYILAGMFSRPEGEDRDLVEKRFAETAQRFYPLLKMREGYTVFRPLIRYCDHDILEMIGGMEIPVLSTPCEFADFRPKRILGAYYRKMGLRFDYELLLDFAKNHLNLPDARTYTSVKKEEYLRHLF